MVDFAATRQLNEHLGELHRDEEELKAQCAETTQRARAARVTARSTRDRSRSLRVALTRKHA